jgi:hypothetical protein
MAGKQDKTKILDAVETVIPKSDFTERNQLTIYYIMCCLALCLMTLKSIDFPMCATFFNIIKFCILNTEYIYALRTILKIDSHHSPKFFQPAGVSVFSVR